jgi:hypothetical protein
MSALDSGIPSAQAALLAVKSLNAGYGDIEVLSNINLEIRR